MLTAPKLGLKTQTGEEGAKELEWSDQHTWSVLRKQILWLNFGTLHFYIYCRRWEHLYGDRLPWWQAAPLCRLQVTLKIQTRRFLNLQQNNFVYGLILWMRRHFGKTRIVTSTADVCSASAGSWRGVEAWLPEAQGDSVKLRCVDSAPGQTSGSVSQIDGRATSAASAVRSSVAETAAGAFVTMQSESGSGPHPPGNASTPGVKPGDAFTPCCFWEDRGVPHRDFGARTGEHWDGAARTGVSARSRRVSGRGEK